MGKAYTPPTLSWHAALRWVERAAGLADDVHETRLELARELGKPCKEVSDRAVLERMGVDRKALARRLLTPGINAAIEAGAHSIQIDGVTFIMAGGRICTAIEGRRMENAGRKRAATCNFDQRKANRAMRRKRRKHEERS